jgi:hypothetical protein
LVGQDLFDMDRTQTFIDFCEMLPAALAGNSHLRDRILAHAATVKGELAAAEAQLASLADSFLEIISELPPKLIKELRSGKSISKEHLEPIAAHVVMLSQSFYRKHPLAPPVPQTYALLRETIVFRKSLSIYLLVLDWIARGGYGMAKPPTFANDIRDAMQAGWATYFDDFLTEDSKARQIHSDTVLFLSTVFPLSSDA